jgi:hypothetical protein
VVGRILTSITGEVGQGRRLGQHGEVGDSFEAHRRVEPHRRGLSVAWRRGSSVLGWRASGRHGGARGALAAEYPTTLDGSLTLL